MKEIELREKRRNKEKHFLLEDGSILAKVYSDHIHYKKDGKYEEIDNTLVKTGGYYHNNKNDYQISLKEFSQNTFMKLEKENDYLDIKLKESNHVKIEKRENRSRLQQIVSYQDILAGIDLEYQILPTKVKETIILKKRKNIKQKMTFVIDTNLELILKKGTIVAQKKDQDIFTIEVPYMADSEGKINQNIFYDLRKIEDGYELDLVFDTAWLNRDDVIYPVYVDPTIINNGQVSSLQDTYIYPGDNGVDKNIQSILKAGVERIDGVDRINRTLIKFDLPEIGTGSEIVGAYLTLAGYLMSSGANDAKLATIHRVTEDWNESNATWEQMHDKYDSKVESIYYGSRSYLQETSIIPAYSLYNDITDLVKRWYNDTPNYGVLIKAAKEEYQDDNYPAFFSKNNIVNSDLVPMFQLVYRNQNGLENYMDYKEQNFVCGSTFVNTFHGNMTGVWNIGQTIGGRAPVGVGLIYNSNDVVLNHNTIYGTGYRLSFEQTIKEQVIQDTNYLEYLDEDGTTHYFYEDSNDSTQYYDEDGLELVIHKNNTHYIMADKNGNQMTFTKIGDTGYLTEIKDVSENVITIEYNSNHVITKITDGNGAEINFYYEEDMIRVVSPDRVVKLHYSNDNLIEIESLEGTTSFSYQNKLIATITDVTGIKYTYEYYSQKPYRMKKVTQYGLNNTLGNAFTLVYGFHTTRITDHLGRVNTLIFNSQGNVISNNRLSSSEDISNAYSIVNTYGDETSNKNRLLSSSIPVGYVKNYLTNTSFESNDVNFTRSDNMSKGISEDFAHFGNQSLKMTTNSLNQYMEQSVSVPKGKYYTFSGYFKNSSDMSITLYYMDENNNEVFQTQDLEKNDVFTREDVFIYYSENATSDLIIRINLLGPGINYMDDIQLEEGEVANSYNMIENSDFSSSISDWQFEAIDSDTQEAISTNDIFEVVDFNNHQNKALKVKMDPLHITRFSKTFPIKGKKGDLYHISFFYKNEGIKGDGATVGNSVMIYFKPVGKEADYCILPSSEFNTNPDIWQYFSFRYGADEDYESIKLIFNQGRNANNFYITNLTFYKDLSTNYYHYDENGNVTSIKDARWRKVFFPMIRTIN